MYIAISDQRIEAMGESQVCFGYKDYRDGKRKSMPLPVEEFIRRFLSHVLPPGFKCIRHYGFFSNRTRAAKLETIRTLLNQPPPTVNETPQATKDSHGPKVPNRWIASVRCASGGCLRVCHEIAPKRLFQS